AATPMGVRRLISRCLEKDVKRRQRDIGDARVELEQGADIPTARPTSRSKGWLVAGWLAALVTAGVAVLGWSRALTSGPARSSALTRITFDGEFSVDPAV